MEKYENETLRKLVFLDFVDSICMDVNFKLGDLTFNLKKEKEKKRLLVNRLVTTNDLFQPFLFGILLSPLAIN